MSTKYITPVFAILLMTGCAHVNRTPQPLMGIWHTVEGSDTASSLASRYGSTAVAIKEINDLPGDGSLRGRGEVFVPKKGGALPGTGANPPAPLAGEARPQVASTSSSTTYGNCTDGNKCLLWPADGKVSSVFGKLASGHHDGLDITGAKGSKIMAANDGKVLYSGDAIKGYGNLVIISHGEGVLTVYAHNDKNLVKEGDTVKRGETIAEMGNSGTASAVHVHFEVRINEQPKDPLTYLPKQH